MFRSLTAAAALTATLAAMPAAAQEPVVGWAMKPALEGLDRDGDGAFTIAEIGGTRVPPEFDIDGDGAFSLVELSQGYFALSDANDDGYLDPGELQAMTGLAAAGVFVVDL
jgi:hypothetical protein